MVEVRQILSGPAARAIDRMAVELCAGLGGIGIGLRALGFHVAKAYDSWEEAVAIYNHNFGGGVAATANLLIATASNVGWILQVAEIPQLL